jgi:hypothetical protein
MSQADTPVLIRTSAKPPQDQDEKAQCNPRGERSDGLVSYEFGAPEFGASWGIVLERPDFGPDVHDDAELR